MVFEINLLLKKKCNEQYKITHEYNINITDKWYK